MEHFKHTTSINEIIELSRKEPLLIFKHSLTCPVSAGAYKRMIEGLEKGLILYPTYIVIVQKDRELSNEIAKKLEVIHESPQLILVRDEKAVYDTSHSNIQVENIPKVSIEKINPTI